MNLPPLHPAIVHFPIALIGFWFVAELIGYFSRSETARTVAWWSLVGAVIGGAFSVLFGYIDMWRASLASETHELVHTHLQLGWILVVSIAALAIWRWFLRRQPGRAPGGGFLTAAVFVFALTMFQGWYGGEMAYAHGAGVAAAGQGMHPPEIARQRLTPIAEALRKLPFLGEEKGHHEGGHKHGEPSGEMQSAHEHSPSASASPSEP